MSERFRVQAEVTVAVPARELVEPAVVAGVRDRDQFGLRAVRAVHVQPSLPALRDAGPRAAPGSRPARASGASRASRVPSAHRPATPPDCESYTISPASAVKRGRAPASAVGVAACRSRAHTTRAAGAPGSIV